LLTVPPSTDLHTLSLHDALPICSAQRLLAQERAARAAEAESAALAERARIAREIHDVLAHSLSAQLVHLEAARLLIEVHELGREDRKSTRLNSSHQIISYAVFGL